MFLPTEEQRSKSKFLLCTSSRFKWRKVASGRHGQGQIIRACAGAVFRQSEHAQTLLARAKGSTLFPYKINASQAGLTAAVLEFDCLDKSGRSKGLCWQVTGH